MRMLEPLGTGAADGALAAGFGNEVFPFLGRAGFEELTRPLQIFFVQRRIVQNALDVGQPFVIPVGNPGGLDKFAKVLVAAAIVHPATVRTLELPPQMPARDGTALAGSCTCMPRAPMEGNVLSNRGTSMRWPTPLRCRAFSAMVMLTAAWKAA